MGPKGVQPSCGGVVARVSGAGGVLSVVLFDPFGAASVKGSSAVRGFAMLIGPHASLRFGVCHTVGPHGSLRFVAGRTVGPHASLRFGVCRTAELHASLRFAAGCPGA